MSTLCFNGLCQVEVKLKFRICYRPCVQPQPLCLGQVVTIVLGQVVTTVTTLGRLELCSDNDWENHIYISMTCERFISLMKPRVLVYNQYGKC